MKSETILTLGLVAIGAYVAYKLIKPVTDAENAGVGFVSGVSSTGQEAIGNLTNITKPVNTLGNVISEDIVKANNLTSGAISSIIRTAQNLNPIQKSKANNSSSNAYAAPNPKNVSVPRTYENMYTAVQKAQIKNPQSGFSYVNLVAEILQQQISPVLSKSYYFK